MSDPVAAAPAESGPAGPPVVSPPAARGPLRFAVTVLVSLLIFSLVGLGGLYGWSYRWLSDARRRLDAGSTYQAEENLGRFLRLHPRHGEARLLLGLVLGHKGRWDESLEQLRLVASHAPVAQEARYREGDALIMLNRFREAEQVLAGVVQSDPKCVEAYSLLIHLYRWQEREKDCERLVWQVYPLVPEKERHHLLAEWFRIRYAQFKPQTTIARLRASIDSDPEDLESRIGLAQLLYREKELAAARVLLEPRVVADPANTRARALLITCLLDEGNSTAARPLLEQWPEAERDERYWFLWGRWQQDHGQDLAGAAESFRQALAVRPDDREVIFRLSGCLRRLEGYHEESERLSAVGLKIRDATKNESIRAILDRVLPNLSIPENRYRLGQFYETVGYTREARLWYESALLVNPDHQPTRSALARLESPAAGQP